MEYQVEGDSVLFCSVLVMSILQTNKLLQIINRNLIMNAIMRAMNDDEEQVFRLKWQINMGAEECAFT